MQTVNVHNLLNVMQRPHPYLSYFILHSGKKNPHARTHTLKSEILGKTLNSWINWFKRRKNEWDEEEKKTLPLLHCHMLVWVRHILWLIVPIHTHSLLLYTTHFFSLPIWRKFCIEIIMDGWHFNWIQFIYLPVTHIHNMLLYQILTPVKVQ